MKLLVWACSICLIGNGVSGLFFDELGEFFGGTAEETTVKPVSSTEATTKDFLDGVESAATNLDGVWQKFRKELLNLMNNFSGSDDDDGQRTTTTSNFVLKKPNVHNEVTTTTTMSTPTSTTNINIISTTKQELP